MEFDEERVLRFALEVDDDVAADEQVNVSYGGLVAEQVVALESHQLANLRQHRVQAGCFREVLLSQRRGSLAQRRLRVKRPRGFTQNLGVDVCAEDVYRLQSSCTPGLDSMLVHQDRERVRLLTRGAPGAPDAQLLVALLEQGGKDFLLDHRIRLPIAEE